MDKKQNNLTIFDVAKKAGVSAATVSRVINDGKCSAKTKQKVLRIIKELNYIPNQSARTLGSIKSMHKEIAVITNKIDDYIFTQLLDGIQTIMRLYAYNYNIFTIENKKDYEHLLRYLKNSSEYIAIIDFCYEKPVDNKITVSLNNIYFTLKIQPLLLNNNLLIDTTNPYFNKYLANNLLASCKIVTSIKACDYILVDTIEQAAKYLLKQVKQPVLVLQECQYSEELLNIKHLAIDFYSIGIILARTTLKKIKNEKIENTVCIEI